MPFFHVAYGDIFSGTFCHTSDTGMAAPLCERSCAASARCLIESLCCKPRTRMDATGYVQLYGERSDVIPSCNKHHSLHTWTAFSLCVDSCEAWAELQSANLSLRRHRGMVLAPCVNTDAISVIISIEFLPARCAWETICVPHHTCFQAVSWTGLFSAM